MNETRKQPSVAGPRVAAVSSVDIVAISPRSSVILTLDDVQLIN